MQLILRSKPKIGILVILIIMFSLQPGYSKESKKESVILKAMTEELERSMEILGEKGSPPPYFIGYQISDNQTFNISSSFGALKQNNKNHSRQLYVEVRVGNYNLDNTHNIRGDRYGSYFDYYKGPVEISLDNDADSIKSVIWLETDEKYKAAVEKMIKIKTNKGVSVKEEDQSDDFSKEKPNQFIGPEVKISLDPKTWENKLNRFSALFNQEPLIYTAEVVLSAEAENKYYTNSEGTQLQHGRNFWRIGINATTKAEDGMLLRKYKSFNAHIPENLPGDKEIEKSIKEMIKNLLALRNAPIMEPYTGPAILSGESSAVFFHEIFGHRMEGHRQKNEDESQTFTKKINQQVLPTFLSVYDDPSMAQFNNKDLNGHYLYDDEGVKAQSAILLQKGVLKGFLMSRSPIKGFSKSNGHGRSQIGLKPVSRQGVLVVKSDKTLSDKELRNKLIKECKTQGKEYGLLFKEVTGGFTNTTRYRPEVFNVTPVVVYKIYTDKRPDELVRGVNLIGTPLTSFSKIIAAGNHSGIFNGYCGAESGSIPASAIAPPMLTTQIEVQKKSKGSDKPPVLAPPTRRKK